MTVSTISQNAGATYSGVTDAFLKEAIPTTNASGSAFPEISSYGAGDRGHWLLKFGGLSNIPSTDVVSDAKLKVYASNVNGTAIVDWRKAIVDWTNSQATWNIRKTATNWTTAGAFGSSDVDLTVVSTQTLTTAGVVYTFSGAGITALVNGWVNGSIVNNGFLGVLSTDATPATQYAIFAGLSDTTNGPVLEVTHSTGGPTVSTVSSNSATEGSSIVHTVTLSSAVTGSAATYAISIGGGTATGGGTDYTSTLINGMFSDSVTVSGGNISVPVGVSTFTITIPTTNDLLVESSETYTLTVGGVSGTGTITDGPIATISNVIANNLSGTMTFTVTLSLPAPAAGCTIMYATNDISATAGVNYTTTNGILSFAQGETSKTITIPILP